MLFVPQYKSTHEIYSETKTQSSLTLTMEAGK